MTFITFITILMHIIMCTRSVEPTIQSNECILHTWLILRALPLNLGQVQRVTTIRYQASGSTVYVNFAPRLQSRYNARRRTLNNGFEMSVGTRVK